MMIKTLKTFITSWKKADEIVKLKMKLSKINYYYDGIKVRCRDAENLCRKFEAHVKHMTKHNKDLQDNIHKQAAVIDDLKSRTGFSEHTHGGEAVGELLAEPECMPSRISDADELNKIECFPDGMSSIEARGFKMLNIHIDDTNKESELGVKAKPFMDPKLQDIQTAELPDNVMKAITENLEEQQK